jgi:hypothetical protein
LRPRSAPVDFCVQTDPQPDVLQNFQERTSIFWPGFATKMIGDQSLFLSPELSTGMSTGLVAEILRS